METIELNSAEELLGELRPSNIRWRHAAVIPFERPLWFFRGQKNSEWGLVPSIFRVSGCVRSHPHFGSVPLIRRYNEWSVVKRFLDICDREGLLPSRFEFKSESVFRNNWMSDINVEIPAAILNLYALAQHHGLETRLLDWSFNPLAAAYFAAVGSWRDFRKTGAHASSHFAVWAVAHHGSRQVKIFKPQLTDNLYLKSQKGCFTYAPNADEEYAKYSRWRGHEELLSEDESDNDGTIDTGQSVLKKIIVPSAESERVLILLRYEGIDEATLMPSLDAIARCTRDDLLLHSLEHELE